MLTYSAVQGIAGALTDIAWPRLVVKVDADLLKILYLPLQGHPHPQRPLLLLLHAPMVNVEVPLMGQLVTLLDHLAAAALNMGMVF